MIRKFKKFLIRNNVNKWAPLVILTAGLCGAGNYKEAALLVGVYFIVKNKNL